MVGAMTRDTLTGSPGSFTSGILALLLRSASTARGRRPERGGRKRGARELEMIHKHTSQGMGRSRGCFPKHVGHRLGVALF